jgi:predicted ATPase/DNA-binding SARP family transcriptional activator
VTHVNATGETAVREHARPPRARELPVELTSFVGRDRELADLVSAVECTRLLSLVGPGGSGKSRLALRLTGAVAERFTDGVHWIDLAAWSDPTVSVPAEVAVKLRLHDVPGTEQADAVCDHLRSRRALLIFDGCEHLIDSCAVLITQILAECREVLIVATTRESLKIAGETEYPVPPLSQPPDPSVDPVTESDLLASGAVRLFVDRVGAVQPGFTIGATNATPVARICHLLDGMPLALELAAARTRALSVDELSSRLEDSISVLTSPTRTVPARHRTLRATLDWSYRLLSDQERRMLAELSVFTGGFTLDAAEAVCAADADESAVDLVTQLVDKSLVFVLSRDRNTRFRLLQTVRRYAAERLADSEHATAVATRHARFYLALTASADSAGDTDQRSTFDLLDGERDNLRTALTCFTHYGDAEAALEMTTALAPFWSVRGHYREGQEWLDLALHVAGPAPEQLRAKALVTAGRLAQLRCDYSVAVELLRDGLGRCTGQDAEDERVAAAALQALGSVARERGEYADAMSLHHESLQRWTRVGDERNIVRTGYYLGFAAWLSGDHQQATARCMDSLMPARRLGDYECAVSCLIVLGGAADTRGEAAEADVLLREALEVARDIGFAEGEGWALNLLGVVAGRHGDHHGAGRLLRESLRIQSGLGDLWRVASILDQLVAVAAASEDGQRAGLLVGASIGLRTRFGTRTPEVERADRDAAVARADQVLGAQRLAAAITTGQALSLETALDLALAEPGERAANAGAESTVEATPARPTLSAQALGVGRVRLGDDLLTPADFSYAKPRELLFFLLDRPDCSKEEIGAALWPWSSPAQLRNSFHTTLHHLRQALRSPSWITFRNGRYGFDRSAPYVFDVEVFTRLVQDARDAAATDRETVIALRERATMQYHGDYLTDLAGEAWISDRRTELRRIFETALFDLGAAHAECGRYDAALDAFRRLVTHDPLIESAHRELIRCYAKLGDNGRALQHYRDLVRLLRAELGVAPSPETAQLAANLRASARTSG